MDEDEVDYVHKHNVFDSVAHIFREHDQIDMAEVNSYRASLDYTPFLNHMLMAPDLIQFLQVISPDYHRAISTNRTNTMDLVLDMFKLRPWFEMVVTALTAPRPKPAPDGLHMILDHFGLQVDEAIYIGDSTVDRDHCAAVGMELIAFKNPDLEARHHVNCFMDILKLPPFN
jgi:phosphoglycolate phosphatase-like HAD superfamily hydrolase